MPERPRAVLFITSRGLPVGLAVCPIDEFEPAISIRFLR